MQGYAGQILWIDLTTKKIWKEKISRRIAKNFIGGRGIGVKIMYDNVRPDINPLDPENILVFMTGPTQGTIIPCSGRFATITKSPLTGLIHDSHSGGYFGPELKYAGYDGIVIRGKSENIVYIYIKNDQIDIRSGQKLWGRDVFETTKMIKKECVDSQLKIAAIGQAGERLVKYSCIMNDLHRAAARNGAGAVMGAKRLKAIAVRGSNACEVKDINAVKKIWKRLTPKIREKQKELYDYGTSGGVESFNEMGIFPVRNFTSSVSKEAWKIDGRTIAKKRLTKKRGCFACVLACSRFCLIKDGKYAGNYCEGPEYETCWSFGSQCGNEDIDTIIMANTLCNKYGIDTISAGNIIGFAMECYEKDLLQRKVDDGLSPKWGNRQFILKLIEKIALREGLGNILAEGVKKAAEAIDPEAEKLAMHCKGLEFPAYEPRAIKSMGLQFATCNSGANHAKGWTPGPVLWATCLVEKKMDRFSTKKNAWLVKNLQDIAAVVDSLILCTFVSPASSGATSLEDFSEIMYATSGIKISAKAIYRAGERIFNLERAFNSRETEKAADRLPDRIVNVPLPSGPAEGQTVQLDEMLQEYYTERGWVNGIPTAEKLKSLKLDYVADELQRLGKL